MGDLRRAPARCSIRPVHRSKLQVAACSRADASHGLSDVTLPLVQWRQRTHNAVSGVDDGLYSSHSHMYPSCTAQPRACGSKYHLNPSSWARAVPVSRLASCFVRHLPIGAAIDVARAHRVVALQYAFVGRCHSLERLSALQCGTDASQLMT